MIAAAVPLMPARRARGPGSALRMGCCAPRFALLGGRSAGDYNRERMEILRRQFERHFGTPPERVEPVQGGLGGSGRAIVRLASSQHSAIGVLYDVRAENTAFLSFSRHFRQHGLAVPEIYEEDLDAGAYLEEDLGDTTLFQFLRQHRQATEIAPEAVALYRRAVEELPRFQVEAGRDLDYSLCYPRASFDRQSMAWDLNYFKYFFLRLAGVPFHEEELEKDFSRLMRFLLQAPREFFLYRDFQSRNIMVREGEVYFVDYQGGRRGALQYDVASLLFDAKAELPPELRQTLLEHYLESLAGYLDFGREEFLQYFQGFVYMRVMQALGAYGFRGFYERKPHFLESVPYALNNVRWLMRHAALPLKLPELMSAFAWMIDDPIVQGLMTEVAAAAAAQAAVASASDVPAANHAGPSGGSTSEQVLLTVTVSSFSYHRGPVADESGHGGGYVFDARGLPNPGREERFKRLSGQDTAVVEFLQAEPRVRKFLDGAMTLVESSIEEYRRRGFQNLMVSFGCTGGQHRSVYLAEEAARRLRGHAGERVVLRHREQDVWVR
jgi:aminoglycoside/choline kinase family phosphotransferase